MLQAKALKSLMEFLDLKFAHGLGKFRFGSSVNRNIHYACTFFEVNWKSGFGGKGYSVLIDSMLSSFFAWVLNICDINVGGCVQNV